METRLTLFLYLMMRDEVPTSVIAETIQAVDEIISSHEILFTNEHLERLAREYTLRILDM